MKTTMVKLSGSAEPDTEYPTALNIFTRLGAGNMRHTGRYVPLPQTNLLKENSYTRIQPQGDVLCVLYEIILDGVDRSYVVFAEDAADIRTYMAVIVDYAYKTTKFPVCRLSLAKLGRIKTMPGVPTKEEARVMLADAVLSFAHKGGTGISMADFLKAYDACSAELRIARDKATRNRVLYNLVSGATVDHGATVTYSNQVSSRTATSSAGASVTTKLLPGEM